MNVREKVGYFPNPKEMDGESLANIVIKTQTIIAEATALGYTDLKAEYQHGWEDDDHGEVIITGERGETPEELKKRAEKEAKALEKAEKYKSKEAKKRREELKKKKLKEKLAKAEIAKQIIAHIKTNNPGNMALHAILDNEGLDGLAGFEDPPDHY